MANEKKNPVAALTSASVAHYKREQAILRTMKTYPAPRGRARAYDWTEACITVFGSIYREGEPEKQKDIEGMLLDWFADSGKEPTLSSARTYAKLIWQEVKKGQ